MNYPIWDIPAPGLLIAVVAVVHVFISHFAVGGGLFLVLTERKARRANDAALLEWLERHSRFFILLTLVGGALTGVGIWFTIALVHPAATASLIATFVWGWAIEWTFFVVEIAAAMVYYYGWRRLDPATHLRIGWIYFAAAWLSLAVINGILTYMLTPGKWLATHGFWDGVLNPTYVPGVIVRTAAAIGLAGLYAVFVAAWIRDADLRARVARYAAVWWILPTAIVLPFGMALYLSAANSAGVPVGEILGTKDASLMGVFSVVLSGSALGHPIAQRAIVLMTVASAAVILLTIVLLGRVRSYGAIYAGAMMACGFVALGGAEWLREDLRKPYVINGYMFVNGIRPADVDAINSHGLLRSAMWARTVPDSGDRIAVDIARGREIFRLSCSSCHTVDGYLGVRRLVRGVSVSAAESTIRRLDTWRGRRMPPFAGTPEERHALATYLASVGGLSAVDIVSATAHTTAGAAVFEDQCAMCHGPDSEQPFSSKGRTADELYELIGRLHDINDMMPGFDGTDAQRRALAEHLTAVDFAPTRGTGGAR